MINQDDPMVKRIADMECTHHYGALRNVANSLRDYANSIDREIDRSLAGEELLIDGQRLVMAALEVERRVESVRTFRTCVRATPPPAAPTEVEAAAQALVDQIEPWSRDLASIERGATSPSVTRKGVRWNVLLIDYPRAASIGQALRNLRVMLQR